MQRQPRIIETGGRDLSSFTSWKNVTTAIIGLKNASERLELRKFCPKCGKVTLHKETK